MINPEQLTTVLFDLDGTLRHSIPHGEDVFMEFAVGLGAPADPETRKEARRWAHRYWADSECLLEDVKTYGKENGDFWENYELRHLKAMGISPSQADEWAPLVHRHMNEGYQSEDHIPEDIFPTLKAMRQAGYTLGLVTNRSNPVDEYVQETGLEEHLDFYFAAGEIGTWKPKPEIFYYALGLANAKPQETIYVGDNYYADVVGAQNANIQPILIDPHNIFPDAGVPVISAIGELRELLVLEPNP